MIDSGKFNLLGVTIAGVDYEAAVNKVIDAAQRRIPLGVSALAVHGVMTGVLDAEHRYRLNALELLVPDGQPVRWGINWLHGAGIRERVYGPNLMLEICRAAEARGIKIGLFGGTPELLQKLTSNLQERFPRLAIVATLPSRFRTLQPAEKAELVQQIKESGAELVFCGLGCPRQETWAFEFKDELSMPVIAVGAAFNFHAGVLAQAPPWMQRLGLEWLFRFVKEPVRLWKRYLLLNPYYLFLLGCQGLGLRKFDPQNCPKPANEIRYG